MLNFVCPLMQGNQSRSPIERLRKVNQKTHSFAVGALNLDRSLARHRYDLLSSYDERTKLTKARTKETDESVNIDGRKRKGTYEGFFLRTTLAIPSRPQVVLLVEISDKTLNFVCPLMQGNQSRSPTKKLRKVNQKTHSFAVGALNLDRSLAGHHYDLLSSYDERTKLTKARTKEMDESVNIDGRKRKGTYEGFFYVPR
jgi:hypothetical protein